MKAIPKTLATGTNNSRKQVSIDVWNAGSNVHGMTRAELQALTPSAGQVGYLKESGREGEFVWDSANNSANVTRDPNQGLYIPPTSDATGASGAWVRKFGNSVNVKWFGAAGDGTTNDYAAFAAAIDALPDRGGALYVPQGKYRISSTINIAKPVRIIGEGIGQNPGIVDGVSYTGADIYHGSRIVCDAGVAGIVFHPHTTVDSIATVMADINAHYTEWSAFRSSMRDVMVLGPSLSGTSAYSAGIHGIRAKTTVYFDNVWVIGFGDNGFDISAGSSGSGSDYGNADMSILKACHAVRCGNNGFNLEGNDAQVCTLIGCDASLNGGWGFNDDSFLGNTYISCHAQRNNQNLRANASATIGSFRNSNTNAQSIYLGCYIENPTDGEITELSSACVVIGGLMASSRYYTGTPSIPVINGSGFLGNANVAGATVSAGNVQTTGGKFLATGSTALASVTNNFTAGYNATYGCYIQGNGSSHDLSAWNKDGSVVWWVPVGTKNFECWGDINLAGAGMALKFGGTVAIDASRNGSFGTISGSSLTLTAGLSGATSISSTGAITSSGGLVGYAAGAGGAVTQATSKSTGVTLNKQSGQITLNNAALAAATSVSFTLTNSVIAATDTVIVNIGSGATVDAYTVDVTAVAAGSCRIQVRNESGASLGEALVLNFAVIKAANA